MGRPYASTWSEIESKRLNSSCSKQDHEFTTIESQRIRITKSTEKTHEDTIADRGHVSMAHNNMVHKSISMLKQWNPSSKSGNGPRFGQAENETILSMWYCNSHNNTSCCSNTTAIQNSTDQTRLKCKNHITSHVNHKTSAAHFRIGSYPQNFQQQWKSRSYISFNIGMMKRTSPELWLLHDILLDSEKDRWLKNTHAPDASECNTLSTQHIEDCKVGIEEWLMQNFGLRKDFGSENYQIHQLVLQSHPLPQREARTSIVEPSVIKPTNVTNCPRQVHQPQHNHGQTGLKKINHVEVVGNIIAGDFHKTCGTRQSATTGGGYFDTKGSFTGDRWTKLTLLVNIMTHTTFTHSNLSVSSAVVSLSFSSMSKRARGCFATSASAKQKPVHC